MPIHLDPNSLVTSPVCDTMRDSTVPGDSDTDSSALPEVVMDSSSPLCCTAAPPLPLCLESTPHPSGHSCSSPAGMDRWELGTSRAQPRWRAVSPLCPAHVGLVQTLHPHGAPQPLKWSWVYPGVTDTGFTRPLCSAGQAGTQGHVQSLEAGTGAWLCHGIVPALLCHGLFDRKLGDWGAAWGHVCWWKSLLRCPRGFALQGLWAIGERI